MKRYIKRAAVLSLGTFFILLGVVGLFVPFLQGILFLFIGLLILSRESQKAKTLLEKLQKKYPKIYAKVMEYTEKIKGMRMGNAKKESKKETSDP